MERKNFRLYGHVVRMDEERKPGQLWSQHRKKGEEEEGQGVSVKNTWKDWQLDVEGTWQDVDRTRQRNEASRLE